MNYSEPTLVVISGPNGAGKSTHIQAMLPDAFEGILSFNRDLVRTEFERQLAEDNISPALIPKKSTELMEAQLVEHMKEAILARKHFVLETPLSHPDYWRYLDLFDGNGYQIHLNYLCLDKISDCVARVGQRVLEGGHYVAPDTIQGVYQKNLEHIDNYCNTFKLIELYDGMQLPTLLAKMDREQVLYVSKDAMKKKWIRDGMPAISSKISLHLEMQKDMRTKSRNR